MYSIPNIAQWNISLSLKKKKNRLAFLEHLLCAMHWAIGNRVQQWREHTQPCFHSCIKSGEFCQEQSESWCTQLKRFITSPILELDSRSLSKAAVCERDFSCTWHITAQYLRASLYLGDMLTRKVTVGRGVQKSLERYLFLLQQWGEDGALSHTAL